MLQLEDDWVWDFWLARDGGRIHAFFLTAPKSLGDPDLRHANARIGHAVTDDLRTWELLPDALGPGTAGAWDDQATWTGSVLRHEGRWHLFYTGISTVEDGLVQRIGVAHSDDLVTWEKSATSATSPVLSADARWYERLDLDIWMEETWRDPWVFPDPDGAGFHMYLTARADHGEPDGRGVIGHAWSPDLRTWEARPPVTEGGDFGHLEVPQLVELHGRHYLVFSVYDWAHSALRQQRSAAVCGTHYLIGDGPLGPFRSPGDDFLSGRPGGPYYAGKLVEDPGVPSASPSGWVFMSWAQFADDGSFVGALADPVPVRQAPDGTLQLGDEPGLSP